jgi:hypothetical protein
MAEPFDLCILFGDAPDRPPAEIAPGWEMSKSLRCLKDLCENLYAE